MTAVCPKCSKAISHLEFVGEQVYYFTDEGEFEAMSVGEVDGEGRYACPVCHEILFDNMVDALRFFLRGCPR